MDHLRRQQALFNSFLCEQLLVYDLADSCREPLFSLRYNARRKRYFKTENIFFFARPEKHLNSQPVSTVSYYRAYNRRSQ